MMSGFEKGERRLGQCVTVVFKKGHARLGTLLEGTFLGHGKLEIIGIILDTNLDVESHLPRLKSYYHS